MMNRRDWVKLSSVGTALLVFSPSARSWARSCKGNDDVRIPRLDGVLFESGAPLEEASQDVGYVEARIPWAVLQPGSVEDIQKMVRFCRRHRISISARGQGHTTDGQGLNEGGLIVEMSHLAEIHEIRGNLAEVDAGVRWSDLVPATFAAGLRPPVLTGYLGLSVGGTLSLGGISSTYSEGSQLDTVEELHVVTGKGDLVRCSRHRHSELFHAQLGGLGQCGIIVRATLRLVPALQLARIYTLNYSEPAAFFLDLRVLIEREEVDDAYNFGIPNGAGGWDYQLTVTKYFDPASPPNDGHLLRGLSGEGTDLTVSDAPFLGYAFRVDQAVAFFESIGMFSGVMHPWFDVFLPDETVEQYVTEVTETLTFDDVGATGFLLLFPQKRSKFKNGALQVPGNTEWVYLYDILTAAPAPGFDAEFDTQMRERNRRLFEQASALGGKRYPIGTLEFSHSDWREHYGRDYHRLRALKRRFDPQGILTPGPRIFA